MKKKIKITATNHIIINATINEVKGNFIIDTGASNSCIDLIKSKKFNLKFEKSSELASSATNKISETYFSKTNTLKIGGCKKNDFDLVLFDMTFINNSLKEKSIKEVDGIIGGDILNRFNACIDYKREEIRLELQGFWWVTIH